MHEEIKEKLLSYFVDYVTERVYLFEIGVPKEQDGHKVFVSMNDRGLKLSPIDLLKGHFLSSISHGESNRKANDRWTGCVRDLRRFGHDEDSVFFKTWLRAQHANSTRGRNRGDVAKDFELIGDAYHRWVIENSQQLGLVSSDDYFNFTDVNMQFYTRLYVQLHSLEASYNRDFPHVFYNRVKDITLQYMVIMAAACTSDTTIEISRKIRLVSYFVDFMTTARIIERRENNYDNLKDYMFLLSLKVRRATVDDLLHILLKEMEAFADSIRKIHEVNYFHKTKDVLYILARFADFLESGVEQTNRVGFTSYVDRKKGSSTFDIEHLIPDDEDAYRADLLETTDPEFDLYFDRHNLGGLILLQRGVNRSLKDKPYSKKLAKYSGQNILAQSLTSQFYENSPQVNAFVAEYNLKDLEPKPVFGVEALESRGRLYLEIANIIWSEKNMTVLALSNA